MVQINSRAEASKTRALWDESRRRIMVVHLIVDPRSSDSQEAMNKAFVREPDNTAAAHCPRCGSLGIAVGGETLRAHLDANALRPLAETAFYCPFPKCEVGYFDQFEQTVAADLIRNPAFPKDPQAPICNCFGFTIEEIEADLRDGSPKRVRELLTRSKSAEAHCQTASPDGRCCMAEVQRTYLRARGLSG
jgi:hypothetical protein